jgi:hypothetical protein
MRFNSRNPSKQEPQPQSDPPNAESAASFNPIVAVTVIMEVGDVSRFESPRQLDTHNNLAGWTVS